MITVKIEINGKVIGEISAVNKGICRGSSFDEDCRTYQLSNGKDVWHNRESGALELAKTMLNRLDEKDLTKERVHKGKV